MTRRCWACVSQDGQEVILATISTSQRDAITKALGLIDWSRPQVAHLEPRRKRWAWLRAEWGIQTRPLQVAWEGEG